jgi:hypothetical protein
MLHTHVTVEMSVEELEHVVMVSIILYGKRYAFTASATHIIPLEELVVMEKMVV